MFAALVVGAPSARPSLADSPLSPPAMRTVWSPNRAFFMTMDPARMTTTVYRAAPGGRGEKVWAMYGWFRVAELANDGEHVVAGYDGMNLIPRQYDREEVMLRFFRRGELIQDVTLDQLVLDFSRLRRTVSHFAWGNYLGLDESGHYAVETVEGRRLRFDVRTGNPVMPTKARRP